MKKTIAFVFAAFAALALNAQTGNTCLCKLDLTLPDVMSKLKLVKTTPVGKKFKSEKGDDIIVNLYKLTYKYSANGIKATIVTGRVANKSVQPQYAELITIKAKNTTIDLFGCTFEVPKKGLVINCTR
jgi:hypothetical protein